VPVITLVGANPQIIEVDTVYSELGATASDNVDGDITDSIVIDSSSVDTSTPGSYGVTYDVVDDAGNSAEQVIRTVTVQNTAMKPIVYVESLEGSVSGKKNLNYQVVITLAGDPASGVFVYGFWSNSETPYSCQTDVPGQCTVSQTTKDVPLTFTIDVLGNNVEYNEDDSVTSVVVDKTDEGSGSGGGNGGGGNGGGKGGGPKK
jgi:hypothetical protein